MIAQARDDHIRREWKMLAETVDRWLFWTFFLITTISTLLFLVILPYRFSFLADSRQKFFFIVNKLASLEATLVRNSAH